MKRVFAVIIVVVLAVGMMSLFVFPFLGQSTVSTPSVTTTTTPASTTTPAQ